MQDVRQSVYDIPRRQLSNTIEGQEPADAAAHQSAGQAHTRVQASSAMYSQAVDTKAAAATATEAALSVAGMDVRQSVYNSSQDISPLEDAWASPHRSHLGNCQILTLHSDDTQPQAAPFDQAQSHASQYSWPGPGWAGDSRQQPQSHDAHGAHPSRLFGGMPNRSSSNAQLDQQDYWQERSQQETLLRVPSASLSLAHHGQHNLRQQVHRPADHAQHRQHAKHEQQREPQHGQRERQRGQHGQHDPEDDNHASAHIHHEPRHRSRPDESCPQSMYDQSAQAGKGAGSTIDANRQYVDRASYPAAASARQPESAVTYGAAAAAPAPVSHQARHASTAPCQASMPGNAQSGWDLDELDVTGAASQPHSHDTRHPLSRDESSSLGSVQEAALWDLVNEEPYQIGLTEHQQQHGNFFSQQSSSAQHAQHSTFESSQQSSQQSSHQASRITSSRPSSAGSSSQVSQQYGHRHERVPARQTQRGESHSAGHWSQAGTNTIFVLFATLLGPDLITGLSSVLNTPAVNILHCL